MIANERAVPCHVWMCRVIDEWVMSHTDKSRHLRMRHVTWTGNLITYDRTWTSCVTYEWVTYEWVTLFMDQSCCLWTIHVTYEWVTSRINETFHVWMCYVTQEWLLLCRSLMHAWAISHVNASDECVMWMCHVTCGCVMTRLIHAWRASFTRGTPRSYLTCLNHMWHDSSTRLSQVTYECAVSHRNVSHRSFLWVTSRARHTWTSYECVTNESRMSHEWVTNESSNESRHVHVTYERVTTEHPCCMLAVETCCCHLPLTRRGGQQLSTASMQHGRHVTHVKYKWVTNASWHAALTDAPRTHECVTSPVHHISTRQKLVMSRRNNSDCIVSTVPHRAH